MTQRKTDRRSSGNSGEPSWPDGADAAAAIPHNGDGDKEWNDPSWHHALNGGEDPGKGLEGLNPAEITERHIGMINALIEQTHPLASAYLTIGATLSPDNPGRDRKVSMGCKLAKATKDLVTVAERLRKDRD